MKYITDHFKRLCTDGRILRFSVCRLIMCSEELAVEFSAETYNGFWG